jgi:hypothetical protein
MTKKIAHIILFLLIISCTSSSLEDILENENSINLQWNKSYEDDSLEKARLGLSWCYSNIGAKILNSIVLPDSNNHIIVDVNNLGFNENALEKIEILHSKILNTEEYQLKNSIDIGRYISLLIGASEHYYAITNIPENLDEILFNYELKPSKGYVDNSAISLKHRVLEYSNQEGLNQLFLSTEIDPQNSEIVEFETIEIMGNGQLKFGVFDPNGNRINGANTQHTNAGKPAKCMWCHESNLNPLFTIQNNFNGFLSSQQLNDTLIDYRSKLKQQQNLLFNGVDFNNTQEHTNMELAYISFMEPSLMRLSNEWNMSEIEIQNRLTTLNTHTHDEFTFLGNLYDRNDVENFAPFESLKTSSSIRESVGIEVNYID